MKQGTAIASGIVLMALALLMFGNTAPDQQERAVEYEYRVMSLAQMFAGASNQGEIQQKLKQMMLQIDAPGVIKRTDLDVPDYNEALNRLAADGWEVVTVNSSNYWVFRRAK